MIRQGDKISLNLEVKRDESYHIKFGQNLFPEVAKYAKENISASKYAIITDSNVAELYAQDLESEMLKVNANAMFFEFPAGEENKNFSTCAKLIDEMSQKGYVRDSCIIALGGGVVGDVAGFVASIFNRGVPFIQVPTTVLAQADSAVGGKTGVDSQYAKNVIGRIYQPNKVFVDVSTLQTLSDEEFRNGIAETIKHGVIYDANFFSYLENNMENILSRNSTSSLEIAMQNCSIKGSVVEIDPNERGLRRILNYGHTVGHAIEKLSDYKLAHGKCVSIGMVVAGRIANTLAFPKADLDRQESLLLMAGLPTKIPSGMNTEDIIALTLMDKKAADGRARYCLPFKIGQMHTFDQAYATPVDKKCVIECIEASR